MITKNATRHDLENALEIINKKYNGNVKFKTLKVLNSNGDRVSFTLTVKDSHQEGGRLSTMWLIQKNHGQDYGLKNPRHIAAACWHVHGDFFDALFTIRPDAEVSSRGNKITRSYGNWDDWNIGSMMYPVYYSEACDCNNEDSKAYINDDIALQA